MPDPTIALSSQRPRRIRRNEGLRDLVRESELSSQRLIRPVFVQAGLRRPQAIASMPGIRRYGLDGLPEVAQTASEGELGGVIVFGIPRTKDPQGRGAHEARGIAQEAVRRLKAAVPDLLVIADVCLCEYTDHGHCGVLDGTDVDDEATASVLGRVAVSLAAAGADVVAPSAMMDGQVAAIRAALDDEGHRGMPVLSYAAKFASALYAPFRDAAGSRPRFGDRRSYQLDPANAREALHEIALDLDEGADAVLVKPGLPCLDILRRARDRFEAPIGAYQVSGEFAMIQAAAERGWIDADAVALESLLALRRAGADFIISYFAQDANRIIHGGTP